MGSFANTVFSLLLGWLQAVTSAIWSALTNEGNESLLQFIGKNWIVISAVLCAVGLIIDFAVYLFRWEPYKVWRSFWRKHLKNSESVESADEEYQEKYTDDLTEIEQTVPVREEEPEQNNSQVFPADSGDQDPYRAYRRPAEETDESGEFLYTSETTASPRRRRRFANIIGDPSDNEQYRYFAPKPIIDQKEAYRPPVYPENWKDDKEQDK